MSNRILLPSIRYVLGFRNREERLIKRAFNDFYYLVEGQHQIDNPVQYKSAFCVALTKTIMESNQISDDADIEEEINQRFPTTEEDSIIEEVEIKFNDDDLLLLKMFFINKIDTKSIGLRLEKTAEEVTDRVEKLNRMWQQDMTLEEYLLQISRRELFKSLDQMMIPIPQKVTKKGRTATVGSITKVDNSIVAKIKNLFKRNH
ncbi:hypothetical protein KMW28_07930 [Flammeovirga yaeyamensis]|uniref:DED domain-containing protein n=1 Tax=Flammeovirga yaeyamensis TaxID=367791 RepID=A0AAX1NCW0_9BACT|nr:hypothetical protein [Flammeovirga yaeyamensis]MBB3699105.1 hypothetical protein [Flammeovirga yaeyamensis]NMF36539.1 hypothetical protein [Flammeovirga yaeyamensis]QWG03503.1 hypothetical protein KMW28_07930 [Flammeovirga yaeyamensis]